MRDFVYLSIPGSCTQQDFHQYLFIELNLATLDWESLQKDPGLSLL